MTGEWLHCKDFFLQLFLDQNYPIQIFSFVFLLQFQFRIFFFFRFKSKEFQCRMMMIMARLLDDDDWAGLSSWSPICEVCLVLYYFSFILDSFILAGFLRHWFVNWLIALFALILLSLNKCLLEQSFSSGW